MDVEYGRFRLACVLYNFVQVVYGLHAYLVDLLYAESCWDTLVLELACTYLYDFQSVADIQLVLLVLVLLFSAPVLVLFFLFPFFL